MRYELFDSDLIPHCSYLTLTLYCAHYTQSCPEKRLNSQTEKTALIALSSIMSIRMLGLFMILPVFSAFASELAGANDTLIGMALGIYGLTQASLQIPFGMLSDHIGRKPVILLGLCLLLIGSLIAANAHSIYLLIIGRALQGAGAIGSTVLALLADLTREESRSKAMAFMGLSIGLAFTVAIVVGPIINHWFHLSGIFYGTALLSLIGMGLLFSLANPPKTITIREKNFLKMLKNPYLLQLDLGIFFQHMILTSIFVVIPIVLTEHMHLSAFKQVSLYFGLLFFSFIVAFPLMVLAEKKKKVKMAFIIGITLIFISQCFLYFFHTQLWSLLFFLFIFFSAFTLLEALLPSEISKIAPKQNKGAAMGIYSTSQFLGIFAGGASGGWVLEHTHLSIVFILCACVAAGWMGMAVRSEG